MTTDLKTDTPLQAWALDDEASADAIRRAAAAGLVLNLYSDPENDGRENVSIDDALEAAEVDPSLVYLSSVPDTLPTPGATAETLLASVPTIGWVVGPRIATRLRARMGELGTTATETALLAKVHRTHLSEIENGKVIPRLDACLRIARVLDAPVAHLWRELTADEVTS